MQLPMKVHAVKIRYREQLLKKMPHGKFVEYRGKRHVIVYYFPGDPSVTKQTAKRYSLTSKHGKVYTPKIEKFIKIKAEYEGTNALKRYGSGNDAMWYEFNEIMYPYKNQ